LNEYKFNKTILNKICDMGFSIVERDYETKGIRGSKTSSLVKKTSKHMIVINFEYRRRIMLDPNEAS
jgi:hypothetical protein